MAAASVRPRDIPPGIPPISLTNGKPPRRGSRAEAEMLAGTATEPAIDDFEPKNTNGKAEDEEFWNTLTAYSVDDWANIILYLYRTDPKINRRNNGRPINLQKYSECIDSERVKHDHGSGGYLIMVNRRSQKSGKYERIAMHYFDVYDLNYPPRVAPGEWLEEPVNHDWKWAKPLLEQDAAAQVHAAQYPPQPNANEQVRTILDAAKLLTQNNAGGENATAKILESVMDRSDKLEQQLRAANDPRAMLELIRELMPKAPTGKTVMEEFLLGQLQSLQAKLDQAATAPKQPTVIEQITELLPTMERFQQLFPGTAGKVAKATGTDWGEVVTGVIDKIGDHLPTIAMMFTGGGAKDPNNGFRLPPAAAAAPAATAPPPAATTSTPEGGNTAVPNQQQQAPANAAGPSPELMAQYQTILTKWGALINNVAQIMIDYAMNETGYDFRDWLITRKGEETYNRFAADANAELLTGMIQLHPGLQAAMPSPNETLRFFQEFFTKPEDTPEDALVPDPTPASTTVIDAKPVKGKPNATR